MMVRSEKVAVLNVSSPMLKISKKLFFPLVFLVCPGLIYFLYKFGYSFDPSRSTNNDLYQEMNYIPDMTRIYSFTKEPVYTTKTHLQYTRKHYFASKDVIIRAVYFDDRQRDKHRNTSVFLALILKNITDRKLITGCQVGDKRTEMFDMKLIGETRYWRIYPQYNIIDHEEVFVHCYDLPARNGSPAYLFYKMSVNSTEEKRVGSELPIMFPAPRIEPSSAVGIKYNLTVLTCTKVFGDPPWLEEWIKYQKAIGVDHVHLIADESFFRKIKREKFYFLENLIAEGFLSVDFWIMWLNNGKEVWYHNQGLIIEDCIYQFRGTYDYVFILDTDDFFIPRVPGEPKAHYYINKLCVKNNKGTCKFRWVEFYPDHFGLNKSTPLLNGNITSQLKNFTHYRQGNRKSIHKTNAVVDAATHYAFRIINKYQRVEVPIELAYVAHMRKGKKPDLKKVKKGVP